MADPNPGEEGLSGAELDFYRGLEKIIDAAMGSHRWGDPFVYGIHQGLSPRMVEALKRRYQAAGWSEVLISEGETGGFMVVLQPAAPPSPAPRASSWRTSRD